MWAFNSRWYCWGHCVRCWTERERSGCGYFNLPESPGKVDIFLWSQDWPFQAAATVLHKKSWTYFCRLERGVRMCIRSQNHRDTLKQSNNRTKAFKIEGTSVPYTERTHCLGRTFMLSWSIRGPWLQIESGFPRLIILNQNFIKPKYETQLLRQQELWKHFVSSYVEVLIDSA